MNGRYSYILSEGGQLGSCAHQIHDFGIPNNIGWWTRILLLQCHPLGGRAFSTLGAVKTKSSCTKSSWKFLQERICLL